MKNMIITLAGLVLAAVVVTGGADYFSTEMIGRKKALIEVQTGFDRIQQAHMAYEQANGVAVDAGSWSTEMNRYGGLPSSVNGWGWSYGTNSDGEYACLSGVVGKAVWMDVIREAGLRFNLNEDQLPDGLTTDQINAERARVNKYFVNTVCGATSNSYPSGYPGTFVATYWLSK